MKKLIFILTLLSAVLFHSCDYLDIVPDDTATLEDAFKNETTAENFIPVTLLSLNTTTVVLTSVG